MSAARERPVAVLVLLALGGLSVLVSTRTFAVVEVVGLARPLSLAGSQVAPALAPIGLAELALAGALSIAGPVARRVLGAVLVVLGAGAVALLVPPILDPVPGAAAATSGVTRVADGSALIGSVAGTAWPAVGAVAGLLGAVAGVLVLLRSGRWSTGGRRYRQQRAVPDRSTDPIAEWDALTRGGDPTDDGGRGGREP